VERPLMFLYVRYVRVLRDASRREASKRWGDKGPGAVGLVPSLLRGDLSLSRHLVHHTTVTDFARARGLSILRPKARAV
jgi:hypothetical protein